MKNVCAFALCVVCACMCGVEVLVRVFHAEEKEREKNVQWQPTTLFKKRVDSANSDSVCAQITNKCRTLLNRPLAIIAGPTRHFQNL